MADRETLAALGALARRLDHLESEVISPLSSTVELLGKKVQESDQDEDAPKVPGHRPWKCEGCRALLGFYDEKADILRIRVKDFHVRVHASTGGWVEVSCRRCGHLNRVNG